MPTETLSPEMLALKEKREREQKAASRIYNDPGCENVCDGCA